VNSFELFALARFGLGYALALSLGIAAIFLAECSPKRSRGAIGMTTGILLQFGTVVGSILGMPAVFGTRQRWWVIFALECGSLLFVHTILPFLHDSPGFVLF
jgi:MFS family permease